MPHLMEVLELLVLGQTLLRGHGPVDSDGREVLVHKQLSQGHAPLAARSSGCKKNSSINPTI